MPVTIKKAGEFLSATEVVEYVHEAGVTYGLPRLASVTHPNKLSRLRKSGGMPEPEFNLAGRDGWRKEALDKWILRERERGVALVLETTRTLGEEELQQLYIELGKQLGATKVIGA